MFNYRRHIAFTKREIKQLIFEVSGALDLVGRDGDSIEFRRLLRILNKLRSK